MPAITFVVYRLSLFTYDALQSGFHDTQNGVLKIALDEAYVQSISSFIETPFMILFLAFTFQLFYNYRKKIIQYFSNTYRLELNWILTFLIIFSVLFLYGIVQDITGSFFTDLNYEERWWLSLFMALATLIVGIKGYFTDTTKLNKLDFTFTPKTIGIPKETDFFEGKTISNNDIDTVIRLMEHKKAYLNPELNLSDLAKMANMTRGQLSETINSGFNKNFNDFVNGYRVEAFKGMLKENKINRLNYHY